MCCYDLLSNKSYSCNITIHLYSYIRNHNNSTESSIDSTALDNYGLVDQDHYAVLYIIMYQCDNGYVEIPESQNNQLDQHFLYCCHLIVLGLFKVKFI